MDPFLLGALGLVALLVLKRPGSTKTTTPPLGGDTGQQSTQTPPQQGGPGVNAKDVVNGAVGLATAAAGVVGALKAAGLFAGGGTAAVAGGTTAAGGGATAAEGGAAAGGAAEGTATAGGITAGAVAVQLGVFAIILAVELAFVWFLNTVVRGSENFGQWSGGRDPESRYKDRWWGFEVDFIKRVVEPAFDPASGRSSPGIPHHNFPVDPYEHNGYGGYVPCELQMSGAEQLRLYRAARYLAIQYLDAYNETEFRLYRELYNDQTPEQNPRGVSSSRFWDFVHLCLATEPWADELQFRCAANYADCEAAARSLLVPNFDYFVRWHRFIGRVDALGDFAVTGWPGIRVFWPGDEGFNKQLMAASGLQSQGWAIDPYWVNGSYRWVAVDNNLRYGLDLQATRGSGHPVLYSPELLELGSTDLPLPSQVLPVAVEQLAPGLHIAGSAQQGAKTLLGKKA